MYSYSLKSKIYHYLRENYPEVIHKGEIGKLAVAWGYENENSGRRCRELMREGLIEVVYNEKHHACYRYIPPKPITPEEREIELLKVATS